MKIKQYQQDYNVSLQGWKNYKSDLKSFNSFIKYQTYNWGHKKFKGQ
jgi:hypothetical protein